MKAAAEAGRVGHFFLLLLSLSEISPARTHARTQVQYPEQCCVFNLRAVVLVAAPFFVPASLSTTRSPGRKSPKRNRRENEGRGRRKKKSLVKEEKVAQALGWICSSIVAGPGAVLFVIGCAPREIEFFYKSKPAV